MNAVEPPIRCAPPHLRFGETERIELRDRDHAVLAFGESRDRLS
jgi:hypothetical protein